MADTTEADVPEESSGSGYEVELTADREEIADVLNGLVDAILSGGIRLGAGEDAVEASFPDQLSLEIELEEEDDEMELELELAWPISDGDHDDASTEKGSRSGSDGRGTVEAADGSKSLARFELYMDQGEEWRWRLRHRNGEVIADSGEGYTSKQNAKKGLRSVVENSPEAEVTEAVIE